MAETHVVSAFRGKRAEISGHIHDLEKRIARQRVALANLHATVRIFSPSTNPDAIPAKRPYRRTRYFGRDELSRLVTDVRQLATGPLTAADIATAVMRAKGAAMDDEASRRSRPKGRSAHCAGFSSVAMSPEAAQAGTLNGRSRLLKTYLDLGKKIYLSLEGNRIGSGLESRFLDPIFCKQTNSLT